MQVVPLRQRVGRRLEHDAPIPDRGFEPYQPQRARLPVERVVEQRFQLQPLHRLAGIWQERVAPQVAHSRAGAAVL